MWPPLTSFRARYTLSGNREDAIFILYINGFKTITSEAITSKERIRNMNKTLCIWIFITELLVTDKSSLIIMCKHVWCNFHKKDIYMNSIRKNLECFKIIRGNSG